MARPPLRRKSKLPFVIPDVRNMCNVLAKVQKHFEAYTSGTISPSPARHAEMIGHARDAGQRLFDQGGFLLMGLVLEDASIHPAFRAELNRWWDGVGGDGRGWDPEAFHQLQIAQTHAQIRLQSGPVKPAAPLR